MSLQNVKMPKLIDKLETKAELEKELVKIDDAIDEITSPKKSKIIKKKSK